jgi:ethanolamine permease
VAEKRTGSRAPVSGGAGVTYQKAGEQYFEKRGLRRHAGAWSLWGLGVAAVISGDFSGWNLGIAEAGWGGMLVATVIIGVMYLLMVYSIAEMSSTMPHTGGAYSFARSAMGPWGGFVTGLAETIEYVITTAVVGTFCGLYADAITDDLFSVSLPLWLWVTIFYVIFVGLNSAGSSASFRFAMVITVISLAVLAVFFVMAVFSGEFSTDKLFDIKPEAGNSTFLPFGISGVLAALPFAIWFFLGIEELPLAAEETHTPQEDIPRGSLAGMFTLLVTAFLVLILNPGVLGSEKIGASGEPILDGFRAILPNSNIASLLSLFALAGLVASFQGIMFAAGSEHVLPVTRGLLPAVPQPHRTAQGALHRPAGQRSDRDRARGRPPRVHRVRLGDGGRPAAQHRRVRRRHRLLPHRWSRSSCSGRSSPTWPARTAARWAWSERRSRPWSPQSPS